MKYLSLRASNSIPLNRQRRRVSRVDQAVVDAAEEREIFLMEVEEAEEWNVLHILRNDYLC